MRHLSRILTVTNPPRAFTALAAPAILASLAFLAGCSDDPVKPTTTAAGTVELTDANNFTTIKNHLQIGTIQTAAEANLTINWDAVVNDVQCHPFDAQNEIDDIVLLRVNSSSQDEVTNWLDTGELGQDKLAKGGYVEFKPDHTGTTAKLNKFETMGTPIDLSTFYTEDPSVTYLMLFQTGTTPGHGARTMTFLQPGSKSNTTVDAPTNAADDKGVCPLLDYQADLHSLTQVPMSKTGPWILDWSGVQNDSQGNKLQRSGIDRLLVGFYADKTVADLENEFLWLELRDTASWQMAIETSNTANLENATNRDPTQSDMVFPGFDTDGKTGSWIMGLFCDSCQSPAPLFVTILKPSE